MARTRPDVITLATFEELFPPMPDCEVSRHRGTMALLQKLDNDRAEAMREAKARSGSAVADGMDAARQHNSAGIADACRRGAAVLVDIEQLEREQDIASRILSTLRSERMRLENSDRVYLAWKRECDSIRQKVHQIRTTHDAGLNFKENEEVRQRSLVGLVAELTAHR